MVAPSFLDRLSVHFDASAHWLLIFALHLFFRPTFKFGQWLLLGALSVLIFPYIAMMVSVVFATRVIVDGIRSKGWFEVIKRISIYVGVLIITAWQCGFFLLGGSKIDAEGYGVFSANALTFVDPGYPDNYRASWSYVVPDQWQGPGQYEGFAFVGAGILILAVTVWILKVAKGGRSTRAILIAPVVFISVLFARFHDLTQLKLTVLLGILMAIALENVLQYRSDRFMMKIAVTLSVAAMSLFAFSNQMLLGQFQIAHVDLDPSLLKLANTFRSSGRFVWPLMYLLIALIIVALIREIPSALITPILLAALVFQVADGNNGAQFTTDAYSRAGPDKYLTSETWDVLGKKYDGVLFSPAVHKPRLLMSINTDFLAENGVLWRDIGVLSQKYGWSMNSSYFSRDPADRFNADNKALDVALRSGSFRKNMLYVFIGSDQWEKAKIIAGPNDLVGVLDGVPVFAPDFYPCDECIHDGFFDRHILK